MKIFLKLTVVVILVVFVSRGFAQQKQVPITTISVEPNKPIEKDTTISDKKGIRQKDIADVIGQLLHHKPSSGIDSITTKPIISIAPAIGYTLLSRFAVVVSGNMAFRTGPQSRVSTIIASTSYTQNKQFILPIQTSIWSKNNKYNFIGNYLFYLYPQSTYGLGSSAPISREDKMDYSYFQFYETVLRHVTGNLYAGAGYILDNHWDIKDKGTFNDYESYGTLSHSIASGITLNAILDSRDNAINPSKGGFASVQYRTNYKFLGSNSNWQSLIIDVRKYYKFPQGSDNIIALWNYDWLILDGRPAYLDLPSTQWDSNSATGRGYIQSRFRGAQMIYLEGEYRYKITRNGLLGGVVFVNLETFSAAPGTRLQTIQPGYGPGVRIKLNTVSKTNITIDYGFGREGSRGLFIDVGEAF